ncbi:hypothetical protein WME90_15815 [Sorangium sp. So ce375]|uniref:hypothetical protein n=1 Tax=Sorangium sp. So ce375 TaxID=3133306 RepID=UPI003F5B54AC
MHGGAVPRVHPGDRVVHQAIVERRPDDVRSGALAEELVQLLERYLRGKQTPGPRAGAGREDT